MRIRDYACLVNLCACVYTRRIVHDVLPANVGPGQHAGQVRGGLQLQRPDGLQGDGQDLQGPRAERPLGLLRRVQPHRPLRPLRLRAAGEGTLLCMLWRLRRALSWILSQLMMAPCNCIANLDPPAKNAHSA